MSFSQDAPAAKASTSRADDTDESGDTDTEIENVIAAKKKRLASPANAGTAVATKVEATAGASVDDGESCVVAIPKLTRSRSKQMKTKPKCKFWAKCFRKNADHLAEFLHPHDVLSNTKGTQNKSYFTN